MEILNNIVTALTTPNAKLQNILTIITPFIETTLSLYLILSILNIDCNKKQKFIYIGISSIVAIITTNFIPQPYNTFVNCICIYILILNIFHTNILKTLIATILPTTIFTLIGYPLLNSYISIFKISREEVVTIPIHRLTNVLITYLIIIAIIKILRAKKIRLQLLDNIDNKNKILIIGNFLLGLIAIIVQTIICFYYVDTLPIIITFLGFITLLFYFALSFYSLTRVIKLTLTTRKLQSAEEYNNTLRILHDSVRSFKHDFDNIVTTIGGYIRTNDMEGLKKYYVELEDDCQRVNTLYILNPDIVNNDGIYNLLTKKYYEAESKNIKVNITFLLDLSTLRMKIYEFARILGILLDNAIEAASECDEKIINIIFRNDEKNSRQLIIIENTYLNKDVDTEKIFEKGVTEKENHTGLGLWEIRKILSKNNNVNLFTSKDEKLFKQQLEIY